MKVSIEWLREFVSPDATPQEIATRLTMAGFEVEAISNIGGSADRLKVVEVTAIKPHPAADKLKICEIVIGREKVEVICGAPNVATGMRAVWAPPGTELPDGRVIEDAVIRGVRSAGMLCSLQELSLEEKSAGIHEFDKSAKVGFAAAPLLGLVSDTVLEINVTPNRGDALSIEGIAREVAALFDMEMKNPPEDCPESGRAAGDIITLKILDPIGCPRYVAKVIENVRIGPSPAWMQRRLKALGVRAINNVVDITNYVMLELGQPLHAFDMDQLAGPGIVVRRTKGVERFITLDGVERVLEDDLLICDVEKPVALAGVMGGLNSEVTDSTTNVLLESACFDPSGIRRTSKKLGLSSEASYRFERGVDPCLQLRAANRAASLMAQCADGEVAKGALDDKVRTPQPPEIVLKDERVELYLGVGVPRAECKKLLESIGLTAKRKKDSLVVTPPSWRGDITEEADAIEEVARLYGYDKLPVTLPEGRSEPVGVRPEEKIARRIRQSLIGAGYHEIITLSFMNPSALDRLRIADNDPRRRTVQLLNPLSSEESVLRTTLLPCLLGAAAYNLSRFQDDIKLFEIGRVYIARREHPLPEEPMSLCGIYIPPAKKQFRRPDVEPFYLMKGAVEEILDEFNAPDVRFNPGADEPYLIPGEVATVYACDDRIGVMGRLRPAIAESFEVSEPVFTFELDFAALQKLSSRVYSFKSLPVHPPAFRDIAVVVRDDAQVADMKAAIRAVEKEAIRSAEVFDVYRGKPIPEGFKSVAFSIVYQWSDRSPVDEEVNRLHQEVARRLEKEFGASVR